MKNLLEKDFETAVKQAEHPVVLKFTAEWWPACKQLAPVVSAVSEELPNVDFYSVDVDHAQGLAQQFGVMSIPTMVLFKGGEEAQRVVGYMPEDAVKEFASK